MQVRGWARFPQGKHNHVQKGKKMTKVKEAPFYANCVDCAQEGVRTLTNLSWIGSLLCEIHIEDRQS